MPSVHRVGDKCYQVLISYFSYLGIINWVELIYNSLMDRPTYCTRWYTQTIFAKT